VKVGAYILSKRRHVTHRLQIGVKPDAFNPTLTPGDLVRVRLERVASTGASSLHDYLYEVDRIGKSVAGEVRLELTHFPVDAGYASVVAQEVNAATGTGILLPTGLSGITCDINSSSDTSVPADTSLDPSAWDLPDLGAFDFPINDLGGLGVDGFGFGGFGFNGPGVSNPDDGLDGQTIDPLPTPIGPMVGEPDPGATLTSPAAVCDGAIIVRTLGNLDENGDPDIGSAIIEEVPSASIPLQPPLALGGDTWNGKYISFRFVCPGGQQQVADLIRMKAWNTVPTGSMVVTRRFLVEVSDLIACNPIYNDSNKAARVAQDSTGALPAVANAVSWRLVNGESILTYLCPPGPYINEPVFVGVEILKSDGTKVQQGSFQQTGTALETLTTGLFDYAYGERTVTFTVISVAVNGVVV
jgi:hypothetical protein